MTTLRSLRLASSLGLIGSALLATHVFALTPAEVESLNIKATNGNPVAQYTLGRAFANPSEASYDPVQAYVWLNLAKQNGTDSKALTTLTQQLTPAQLAEGQRRLDALAVNPISPVSAAASPIAASEDPVLAPVVPGPVAPSFTPAPTPAPAKVAAPVPEAATAEVAVAQKEPELPRPSSNKQLADALKRIAIAEAALTSKDREIARLQELVGSPIVSTPAPTAPSVAPAELTALRAERDQLKAASARADLERSNLAAQLLATSRAASIQQAELRAELAKTQTDLDSARRAQQITAAEPAALQITIDQAEAKRAKLATQLETVSAELAASKVAATASQRETDTLRAQLDSARQAAANHDRERDQLNTELADARKAVNAAATELVTTRDQLTQAQAQLAAPPVLVPMPAAVSATELEATARLAALETAKASTDTQLAAALNTSSLQQAEIARLQTALASTNATCATAVAQLANATSELTRLRTQVDASMQLAAELETLRAQLAATTHTNAQQTSTASTATEQLADARKAADSATAELATTREQLRQTQATAAATAIELQQLKTRLALVSTQASTPARPEAFPTVTLNLAPRPSAPTPAPTPAPATVPAPPTAPILSAPTKPTAPSAPAAPAAPRFHIVGSGDTLSRISKTYYGTTSRWNDILQANRTAIRNPDALVLGTKLRIP